MATGIPPMNVSGALRITTYVGTNGKRLRQLSKEKSSMVIKRNCFSLALSILIRKELNKHLPSEAAEGDMIREAKFIIVNKLEHILKARGR